MEKGSYWGVQKQLEGKIRDSREAYRKKLESKLQQSNNQQGHVVRDEEDHRPQAKEDQSGWGKWVEHTL